MNDNDANRSHKKPLGLAGGIAIAVMVGFLGWAGWYAVHAWNALAGIGISAFGWVMIVIGLLFTVGLGAGLMALVFYSNREGLDR